MAQIQAGDSFENGQQVTAERLNTHVDGAVALPGIISEQPVFGIDPGTGSPLAEPNLAGDDKVLVYDTSEDAIRKLDISNLLESGLPTKTGDITMSNNPITPFVRTIVVESNIDEDLNGRLVIFGEEVNDDPGALVQIGNGAANRTFPAAPDVMLQGKVLISGTATQDCLMVNNGAIFEDRVKFNTNGAIKLPAGTDAQKPTVVNSLTGDVRFNTTSSRLEVFNGTAWKQINQLEDLVFASYTRMVNPVGVTDGTQGWTDAGTVWQWRTGSEITVPTGQVWEYSFVGRLAISGSDSNQNEEYNHDAVIYIGDTEVRRVKVYVPNASPNKGQMIFVAKIDVEASDTTVAKKIGLKFLKGSGDGRVGVSAVDSHINITVTKRPKSADTEISNIL